MSDTDKSVDSKGMIKPGRHADKQKVNVEQAELRPIGERPESKKGRKQTTIQLKRAR